MSMENETDQAPRSKSKMRPVIIVITIVVIIVVGAVGIAMSKKQENSNPAVMQQAPSPTTQLVDEAMMSPTYKDGEYNSTGQYISPGGEESIAVTLTLIKGIVENASVISNATRPISKKMQSAFIGGFRDQVIGKNIDELNITKVSGSSLTPKGFNDALEKIKTQAKT